MPLPLELSGAPGKGQQLQREHELREIYAGIAQPLELGFKLGLRESGRPHEPPVSFPIEVGFCRGFPRRYASSSSVPDSPGQFFTHLIIVAKELQDVAEHLPRCRANHYMAAI